ncbi:glycoside hydrolase family 2 [Pontibacter qinzhouensis]|uniref:beta-galactosidase n=1 Tax=Pontibacter qinzhouensis TaxID=2603253 RepID=A0A5C8K9K5_9BACT|nr:glycoside hydrolase family 2 TIM barrel-domain containing protein [Pontibacter qinzhouensis]TXK46793.1 glycoside hydrolase family 2 [Pontibacter qinzhouensis]
MKSISVRFLFAIFLLLPLFALHAQETKVQYLSGTGNDKTVDWQFMVTEGRKSGKWTKIPVPSVWEQQGFGTYNYGHDKDEKRGKEKGLYKYSFKVPANWKNNTVNIVFEGSMTDTEVKLNGQLAGPVHQGSFYRFKYDITNLLKPGKTNVLEVTVAKHSANESVVKAERQGDYWIFGGIFRPVYLEALPVQHIERTALDAKHDGSFVAEVNLKGLAGANEVAAQVYTLDGKKVGSEFKTSIKQGETVARLQTNVPSPSQWTPEFPNLYRVTYSLLQNGKPVHTVSERFGFRTVDFRERDGIYVNGTKIKFKGVNRHSFLPESGRTTNKKNSIEDVQLIKEMNMNAVRMSHYPPDKHFLEVCDSLGLFVIDELTGWHDAYDTEVGSKLAKEMVIRDVNHPSIVIWTNGNEGGHNFDLDPVIDSMDIQKRPVVHPWQNFRGIDTQHYTNYNYGTGSYFEGRDVFFPTEFLHGLYDGGLGAGLYDFWELMWQKPLSAGGFLWVFADEGLVRTDKKGQIDTDGDHAPDGILGPHKEKEGSFYAIKEIWSPIKFEQREITPAFDGTFRVENRYFYTNLDQCTYSYKLAQLPEPNSTRKAETKTGTFKAPAIAPSDKGTLALQLPNDWQNFDVLYITATDPHQQEIFTWSWPITRPATIAERIVTKDGTQKASFQESGNIVTVSANGVQVSFDKTTGLLQQVKNPKGVIPFANGPIPAEGESGFQKLNVAQEGNNVVIKYDIAEKKQFKTLQWTMHPSGWLQLDVEYLTYKGDENDQLGEHSDFLGINFSFPEDQVKGVQWLGNGPYRVWKNRLHGNKFDIWTKKYNNTTTGHIGSGHTRFEYPEFKGYHSNMYWMKLLTTSQPFTVVTDQEDIFLRLFTPATTPEKTYHTAPPFPKGDISFMHGITPIGTKSQKPEYLGNSGRQNNYFDYWRSRPKQMTLYFNFSEDQVNTNLATSKK